MRKSRDDKDTAQDLADIDCAALRRCLSCSGSDVLVVRVMAAVPAVDYLSISLVLANFSAVFREAAYVQHAFWLARILVLLVKVGPSFKGLLPLCPSFDKLVEQL